MQDEELKKEVDILFDEAIRDLELVLCHLKYAATNFRMIQEILKSNEQL